MNTAPQAPDAPDASIDERAVRTGERFGFGPQATRALWQALRRGGGGMAQFDHAELGGHGQWMRGGMVMVGDLSDRALANRVGALADALAALHIGEPAAFLEAGEGEGSAAMRAQGADPEPGQWWPSGLGTPASSGAQNGVRYAWFPQSRRLAIERRGDVEIYDTADHSIGGVSQQQGTATSLRFTSQHGPIEIDHLTRLQADDLGAPVSADDVPAIATATAAHRAAHDALQAVDEADAPRASMPSSKAAVGDPAPGEDVLATIDRLAGLHARGVLTDVEFAAKKAELLARL